MIDKKKVKEEYKRTVPAKGVLAIRNRKSGRVFLVGSMNLYNIENRTKFRLDMANYPNERLLKDWKELGAENFTFEILETLPLKDDPAYDYDEDLEILEMIWVGRFQPLSEKTYNEKEDIHLV